MSRKGTLRLTLAVGVALCSAGTTLAQTSGYSSTPQYYSPSLQRAQLPQWNSVAVPPATFQQPLRQQQFVSQPAPPPATQAYRPSEMPSVNPFANVLSRQSQVPVSYGNATYQPLLHQPLPQNDNSDQPSLGNPQYPAIDEGIPYGIPPQQRAQTPSQNSFYDQPVQNYSSQFDDGYGPTDGSCFVDVAPQGRNGWYGSAAGVIMSRNTGNNIWLSVDQTDIRDRVLNSNDASFSTGGGLGATIGHYFNCGQNSIQLSYWGIFPGTSEANAYGADTAVGIDTILHFDTLEYDAGLGGGSQVLSSTFFFDAERHRIQRGYQAQNLELNLLGHNFISGCTPIQFGWTAGVRYFRFDEDFLYSSDPTDTVFTGAADEVHYGIDVTNNLIGCQIGGRADYGVGTRLNLFANTKVGLYGNHMTHHSRIDGANGPAYVGDPTSVYFGEDVDIKSNKNDFAMIGELSLGATWCLNPSWRFNAGYRAIGVSGVALSPQQIPVDFIGAIDSLRTVNSNGNLILHGAFLGFDYGY